MQIPRSSFCYKPAGNNDYDANLADGINEIALEFPSYGCVRVTAALRVLYERIKNNYFSIEEALKFAERILNTNAKNIYLKS